MSVPRGIDASPAGQQARNATWPRHCRAERLASRRNAGRTFAPANATVEGPELGGSTELLMKRFLHVGCGPARKEHTVPGFLSSEWDEVRFDIDPSASPDIIGTIVDMKEVSSGSFDAVFSSHNIEHVYPHEAPKVLREFYRVLREDGFLVIGCPDLTRVCAAVLNGGLLQRLYDSPMGPITPLDVLYGHIASVAAGQTYMAQRCGFTNDLLVHDLREAGFKSIFGGAHPRVLDLWELAFKQETSLSKLQEHALKFLPA